jgi:hypothetical protein
MEMKAIELTVAYYDEECAFLTDDDEFTGGKVYRAEDVDKLVGALRKIADEGWSYEMQVQIAIDALAPWEQPGITGELEDTNDKD